MKKIMSVIAAGFIVLSGCFFIGCGSKGELDGTLTNPDSSQTNPENPAPSLQTSVTIDNVEYSILHVETTKSHLHSYTGSYTTYNVTTSVVINVNNKNDHDINVSKQSFSLVSGNKEVTFAAGIYPNTTTFIPVVDGVEYLTFKKYTQDTFNITVQLSNIIKFSWGGAPMSEVDQVESTVFSVKLGSTLIGQFYVEIN